MKKALLLCSCLFFCFAAIARDNNTPTPQSFANKKAPLSFMENKGQITDQNYQPRPDIQFQLKAANGLTIFVGNGAIHYQFAKVDKMPEPRKPEDKFDQKKMMEHDSTTFTMYRMDVELIGANKHAKIITEDKQDYYENYYTTGTGENGATVYAYSKITYKDIYPNIDWVLYTRNNELKHEFIVKQGGNPADIKLKYGGATNLQLQKDGSLEATTPQGTITEQAPVSYTLEGQQVKSSFSLKENVLSYEVGNYKGTLVIDPSLIWGTYYGGGGTEGRDMCINANGDILITGYTQSTSSIATVGAYQTTIGGQNDAFIAAFNSSGGILWATYFGGSGNEYGFGISNDGIGNIIITGETHSSNNISTVGASQTTNGGNADAFIAKFNSTGTRIWATFLGGTDNDNGYSVVCDNSNNIIVSGQAISTNNIATVGAYHSSNSGNNDAFIAKFNASGSLIWSTYFGGNFDEFCYGLSLDNVGNIIIAGSTQSTINLATTGAYQSNISASGGNMDAFIAKFSSSGSIIWATYYGSSAGHENCHDVCVDNSNNIIIIGETQSSTGIVSTGAFQTTFGGGSYDVFLTKFSSSGLLQWSTYYGGNDDDYGYGVNSDGNGNIYITGASLSTNNISTLGMYQTVKSSYGDIIIVKFNSAGNRIFGTYYGGNNYEYGTRIIQDSYGYTYVSGSTASTNSIATPGAYQTIGGNYLAFVSKFLFDVTANAGHDSTICLGKNTHIGSVSQTNHFYSWTSNPGGFTSSIANPIVNPLITTTYFLKDSVTGFSSGYDTVVVTVNSLPTINAGVDQTICAGTSILLNATSNGSIQWSNGVVNNQSFIPTISGIYITTATSAQGCINKDTAIVTINPLPTINAGVDQTICAGTTVTLNAISNSTVFWNNSIVNNQSFIPTLTQNYIATATTNFGCIQKDTVLVNVNPLPTINAGTDETICAGTSILLNATSNGSVQWNNSVVNNQSFIPTISGNYIATAISTQSCSNKDTVVVTVNPLPLVNAGIDKNICIGNSTILSATGAINYSWSGGINNNQSFTPNSTSNYVVTGIDANGCSNKDTVQVTVNPLPITYASTTNTAICPNGNTQLTANGGVSYLWTNGDTATTTTINQPGTYYVVATNQYGCSDTSNTITISPKTLPTVVKIKFNGASSVCAPGTVAYVLDMPLGSTTGFAYQWYVQGSAIPGATDSFYNANTTGSYALAVSGGSNCLKYSYPKTATIKAAPTASFSATSATTICTGGFVVLVAPSITGYTYTWLKDGVVAGTGPNKIFKVSGNYTVIAKINGCSDTASPTMPVIVNPLPVSSISALNATTFCAGDSCTLSAQPAGAVYYEWHNGNYILDTTTTPIFNIGSTATIKVLVKDANGCIGKLSSTNVKTKVNSIPLASISTNGSTTISSTGSVKLKAMPTAGVFWQWYKNGNILTGSTGNQYTATSGGSYTVAITKLGCTGISTPVVVTQTTPKEEVNTTTITEGSFELSAYPNPVSEVLTVSVSGIENVDGTILVMDVMGKVVKSLSCKGDENQFAIDSRQWASGVYFIRYKDIEGRTGMVKVVKE